MRISGFRIPAAWCPFVLCNPFTPFVLPLSSCPCVCTGSVWVCGGLGALGGPPGASQSPSSWLLHSRLVPQESEAEFQGLLSASGSALGLASQCPWSTVKSCSASWRGFLPFGVPSAFREHFPGLANTPLTEKVRHKQMNVKPPFLLDLLSTELNVANIYRVPAVCPGGIRGTESVGGLPQSAERRRTEVRGGGPPEGRSGGLGGLACSALWGSQGWGSCRPRTRRRALPSDAAGAGGQRWRPPSFPDSQAIVVFCAGQGQSHTRRTGGAGGGDWGVL